MVYGYCRISRKSQSIDRQVRNIKDTAPDAIIVQEAYTGTTQDRPKWRQLVRTVKSGDTIIFDSVSRMSRSAEEGFAEYESLYSQGVNLIFIKESAINTEAYKSAERDIVPMTNTDADCILRGVNEFLIVLRRKQFKLAFDQAQKEVDDLHARTREGIVTARLEGKQIGRQTGTRIETTKAKTCKDIILKHSRDFGGTLSDNEVRILCGCARNSYYKYKSDIKMKN